MKNNSNSFHRCVVCNKVSNEEISSDYGEQYFGTFFIDKNNDAVCSDCTSATNEVLSDWAYEDEQDVLEVPWEESQK